MWCGVSSEVVVCVVVVVEEWNSDWWRGSSLLIPEKGENQLEKPQPMEFDR